MGRKESNQTKQFYAKKSWSRPLVYIVETNMVWYARLLTAPEECFPQMKKLRTKQVPKIRPGYSKAVWNTKILKRLNCLTFELWRDFQHCGILTSVDSASF